MRYAFQTIALSLLIPIVAGAQDASMAPGTRVRVTAPNLGLERHVATVVETRGDSIVVGRKGRSRTMALSDIPTLEVSTGRKMRVLPYALLGLGVGAIGGYAIGYSSYDGGSFLSNSRSDEGRWVGATLGAVGLLTGAIAGTVHRGDNWVPMRQGIRGSVGGASSGGVSVSFTRAF